MFLGFFDLLIDALDPTAGAVFQINLRCNFLTNDLQPLQVAAEKAVVKLGMKFIDANKDIEHQISAVFRDARAFVREIADGTFLENISGVYKKIPGLFGASNTTPDSITAFFADGKWLWCVPGWKMMYAVLIVLQERAIIGGLHKTQSHYIFIEVRRP